MLAALALAFILPGRATPAVAPAAAPARRGHREPAFIPHYHVLTGNGSVMRELRATAEQARAVAALGAVLKDRFFAEANMTADLDPADRADRVREIQDRYEADLHVMLARFLDPGQVARFDQVALRAAGLLAFRVPRVRAALRLSPEQEAALEDVEGQLIDQLARTRRDEAEVVCRLAAKFEATLAPDQKAAWARLAGEPFVLEEEPAVEPD